MRKTLIKFGIFFSCGFFVLLGLVLAANVPSVAAAENIWDKAMTNLNKTDEAAGYSGIDAQGDAQGLEEIVSNIIKIMLSFVGGIFLILVVLGGYGWMMSGGNEEKLKAAQKRLLNGVLGMLIILVAYIITDFVVKFLLAATGM